MTHFIRHYRSLLILCLSFVYSVFIVNTVPAEEIIYQPNQWLQDGIWISDINGSKERRLYNPPLLIKELSIQKGDRYLLGVGNGTDPEVGSDVYLFDTNNLGKGRKNLTYGRYGFVLDAAISRNGDVVFSNSILNQHPDGIYLIQQYEVQEPIPNAEKLYSGPADNVDWAPNGKEVVFSNSNGIFLLDTITREVTQILDYGTRPVFSPDGNRLAFIVITDINNKRLGKIGIISLNHPQEVLILDRDTKKTNALPHYLTWMPDGDTITYGLCEVVPFAPGDTRKRCEYLNFAVSVSDGSNRPIFTNFKGGLRTWEWTRKSFPVEPIAKLTTKWSQLKLKTQNGGTNE